MTGKRSVYTTQGNAHTHLQTDFFPSTACIAGHIEYVLGQAFVVHVKV